MPALNNVIKGNGTSIINNCVLFTAAVIGPKELTSATMQTILRQIGLDFARLARGPMHLNAPNNSPQEFNFAAGYNIGVIQTIVECTLYIYAVFLALHINDVV